MDFAADSPWKMAPAHKCYHTSDNFVGPIREAYIARNLQKLHHLGPDTLNISFWTPISKYRTHFTAVARRFAFPTWRGSAELSLPSGNIERIASSLKNFLKFNAKRLFIICS